MKTKIIVVMLATLMSLLSIGCSNINPTSSTPVEGTSTALITVNLDPIGSLGKVAAVPSSPTMIVFWVNPPIRPNGAMDTLFLTGSGPYSFSMAGFERGKSYSIGAAALNPAYIWEYNEGKVDVNVGDVAEFNVSMRMRACSHKVKVNIPIKGTPVASLACSTLVICSSIDLGSPTPTKDSLKSVFTPGSVDTVKNSDIIPLHNNPSDGLTTYTIEVLIYCTDGGYYKGSGNIDLAASTDASLSIPLVKYGGTSSLAKMTITLDPFGNLNVTVQFP